jgi:hypothetical protein
MNVQELEAEVERRVQDLTPELLPQLLERFLARDGLVQCPRHGSLLYQYVASQIRLTHAKRSYYRDDTVTGYYGSGFGETAYLQALEQRNKTRKTYRSTTCTCWVYHR